MWCPIYLNPPHQQSLVRSEAQLRNSYGNKNVESCDLNLGYARLGSIGKRWENEAERLVAKRQGNFG